MEEILFPINTESNQKYGKRVLIEFKDKKQITYDDILEYAVSMYYFTLIIKNDTNCKAVAIPKNIILGVKRYVHIVDKYIDIKLETKRLKEKRLKTLHE